MEGWQFAMIAFAAVVVLVVGRKLWLNRRHYRGSVDKKRPGKSKRK